jgi:hypothetical protein
MVLTSWTLLSLYVVYAQYRPTGLALSYDPFTAGSSAPGSLAPQPSPLPSPSAYPGPQVFHPILHRTHYLPHPTQPTHTIEWHPFKLVRDIERQQWGGGGGSRATLNGLWKEWALDPATGKPSAQVYEGGDHCPGFGPRASEVVFVCEAGEGEGGAGGAASSHPQQQHALRLVGVEEVKVCRYRYTIHTHLW